MKKSIVLLLMLVPQALPAAEVIDLWPGQPLHSKPSDLEEYVKDSWGVPCVGNVTRPTLTIHPAQGENSGRAVVVVPGGGYEVHFFATGGHGFGPGRPEDGTDQWLPLLASWVRRQ